ncbi:hypothetical protein DL96DRAFT_1683274 [Flagelloscypha sp. PMI_526]|nr:hypothetical protein DL96DRAFT_1683274 [Flagelloscypha sp. PMI_526]
MSAVIRDTRENGLKVLTIDGEADIRVGVLSALFSLLIMMRRAAHDCPELASNDTKADSSTISIPEALPCKCFDLIVGSGDGGWIAIMLGRLGMSTTEVIETYLEIRSSIHDTYPYNGPEEHWPRDVKGATFDALLKLLVRNRLESGASQEMIQQNPSCFTVALAMHGESNAPHPALFRNYIGRQANLPNCPIWFAIRAAASSTVFPSAHLSSGSQQFLAASQFNFNNPVDEAISEAIELAKILKVSGPPISCLISLGSGHPGVESLCESDLARATILLTKSASNAHEKACRRFQEVENLNRTTYFRLNVEQGFQQDLLLRITSGAVRTHTEMYLRKVDMENLMDHAVQYLIDVDKADVSENFAGPIASTSRAYQGYSETSIANDMVLRVQNSIPESVLIKTYINELYTREFGLPVQKVAEIGDLGFINADGSFEALFNITVGQDKQPQYAVPPGFIPFKVSRNSMTVKEQAISNPFLESGQMTLSVVEDSSLCWRLHCQIEHGALLIIKDATTKISIHQSTPLVRYIQSNYKSWYEFIKEIDTCPREIAERSGLLLVTGIHRNHDWSLGAWTRTSCHHTLSFAALKDVGSNIEIADGWNPRSAPGVRNGPTSQAPSYTPIYDLSQHGVGSQALFIEGFRIRCHPGKLENLTSRNGQTETTSFQSSWSDIFSNVLSFGSTGGAGSPSDLPGYPSSPSSPSSGNTGGTNHANLWNTSVKLAGNSQFPRHPLDDLADEVFEVFPNAQTFILHDEDWVQLKRLCKERDSRSFHIQNNLRQSNECLFFTFPQNDLPILDLGLLIAKEALRQDVTTAHNLALTNKLFHNICNPLLYHSVHLDSLEALKSFLDTIGSNPVLANLVHRCSIGVDMPNETLGFQLCKNLSAVAIFSHHCDDKRSKLCLPPSVTRLACDPSHFTSLHKPFLSPDNVFQYVTHLYLRTQLAMVQLWSWLGQTQLPALRYLATEHRIEASLGRATEDLIPLVKEYLPSDVMACVLFLSPGLALNDILDQSTIDLSDGSIDPRVVLATELSTESSIPTGFVLNAHVTRVNQSWKDSSTTWLWDEAEEVRQQRNIKGKYLPDYYLIGSLVSAEEAYHMKNQSLGPEHPHTIESMKILAESYGRFGRYSDALEWNQHVVEPETRIFGCENPDTLTSKAKLADTYLVLGRRHDALELQDGVLKSRKRVLGPEHPDTLTSMSKLAQVFSDLGRPSDALELQERALEWRKQVLGPEHPDSLKSASNLAQTYSDLCRHTEALKLWEEIVASSARILGPDDPNTLMSTSNLAHTYSSLGRHMEALKLQERTLELRKRILGPEHSHTLASMENLAKIYSHLRRYPAAPKLQEETLELRKRILGSEHPHTLASMENMAIIYSHFGRDHEALKLQEETLELRKRILGPEHPHTLASMENLAIIYSHLGRYHDTLQLQEETLELRKRILGSEHLHTLASMENLAIIYLHLGRIHEAVKLQGERLELRKQILGEEHPHTLAKHPDTLTSTANLARTYSEIGQHREALELNEQILEVSKRILGPEHPNNLRVREEILELQRRIPSSDHRNTPRVDEEAQVPQSQNDMMVSDLNCMDAQFNSLVERSSSLVIIGPMLPMYNEYEGSEKS